VGGQQVDTVERRNWLVRLLLLKPRTSLTRHPASLRLLLPPATAAQLAVSCAKPATAPGDHAGVLLLSWLCGHEAARTQLDSVVCCMHALDRTIRHSKLRSSCMVGAYSVAAAQATSAAHRKVERVRFKSSGPAKLHYNNHAPDRKTADKADRRSAHLFTSLANLLRACANCKDDPLHTAAAIRSAICPKREHALLHPATRVGAYLPCSLRFERARKQRSFAQTQCYAYLVSLLSSNTRHMGPSGSPNCRPTTLY
jgi:hypothetical protein